MRLVCKGQKDELFFRHFIHARGLPRFHIRAAHGKDRIGQAILAYKITPKSNYPGLRDIPIAADNDDAPARSFRDICEQIDRIEELAAPVVPLERSKKGKPRCTIMMLPKTDVEGTIENLLVSAWFRRRGTLTRALPLQ